MLFFCYIYKYSVLCYLYNFSYFFNWCLSDIFYKFFYVVFQNSSKFVYFCDFFKLFFDNFYKLSIVYTCILHKIQKKYKKSVFLFAFYLKIAILNTVRINEAIIKIYIKAL